MMYNSLDIQNKSRQIRLLFHSQKGKYETLYIIRIKLRFCKKSAKSTKIQLTFFKIKDIIL